MLDVQMEFIVIVASAIVLTPGLLSESGADQDVIVCGGTLHVSKHETYIIKYFSNDTNDVIHGPTETGNHTARFLKLKESHLHYRKCYIHVQTLPDFRLQINVTYSPHSYSCRQGYFHVGNDKYRLDKMSMTSYKFCDAVRGLEIISRENYLWMVYDVKNQQISSGEIQIEAYPKARCPSSWFECSPVQCVESGKVCDGRTDCRNGRDEFCGNVGNGLQNRIPETSDSCFLCWNDTVICPSLPIYDDDRGHDLWFMCDGIEHCKDGADERLDMCYRMKNKGTSAMLFQCIPHLDGGYHGNRTVRMWKDRVCDGEQNCRDQQDELQCSDENVNGKRMLHPVSMVIVCCSLFCVVLGAAVFIYRTGKEQSFPVQLGDVLDVRTGPALDRLETFRLDTVTEELDTK